MSGAVTLSLVLAGIIFVLIVAGGVYAIVRHGKAGPNNREARRHYRAKADPTVTPLGEHVPTGPAAAADGLAESQSPPRDAGQNAGLDGGQAGARPSGDRTAEPGRDPE